MPDLSPDQAIDALRGLPEDRQRAILGKLSPEVKTGIMAKLSGAAAPAVAPTPQPEDRTLGNYASEAISGIGRGLKNDVTGVAQGLLHPIDTAEGLMKQANQSGVAAGQEWRDTAGAPLGQRLGATALTGLENAPLIGGMVQHAEHGGERMASPEGVGALAEAATTLGAPELVGPMYRGLKNTSETLRRGAQGAVGAGEKAVKYQVGEAAKGASAARDKTIATNQAADESTLAARGKVDEQNAASASKDAQARKTAEENTLRDRAEIDQKNNDIETRNSQARQVADEKTTAARAKVDQKNEQIKADNEAARLDVLKKNRDADQAYAQKRADVDEGNRAVLRDQAKRLDVQKNLDDFSSNLHSRVETARENALKRGNSKYTTVNEKLNNVPADPEQLASSLGDASESIKGSMTEPPIFKDILKRVENHDDFTYSDLQGYYSELGNELSKGSLPGDIYHAYDVLQEGIGKDMQRIADSKGFGSQLTDARNYWRRMKQTFGKPLSSTDNATDAVRSTNPDYLKSEKYDSQLRLLGSFDPEIPKVAEHVGNLRQGLDALGKEKPLRESLKAHSPRPEPLPLPKSKSLIEYGEPEGAAVKAKVPYSEPQPTPASTPSAVYGEPQATKPVDVPEVNTRAMRENLLNRWARGEEGLNKWQVKALVAGPVGALAGLALGHSGEGAGIGYAIGSSIGPAMVAKFVERPGVREWLTRPPATELVALQQLPYADRIKIVDGLQQAASIAQKTGTRVNPLLLKILGEAAKASAYTGPLTKQLQDSRDAQHAPTP